MMRVDQKLRKAYPYKFHDKGNEIWKNFINLNFEPIEKNSKNPEKSQDFKNEKTRRDGCTKISHFSQYDPFFV